MILTNSYPQLTLSQCRRFDWQPILLVDMFFDWQPAFLWVPIVFYHLVDLSFIRISKLHSGTSQEQWNDSLNNYGDRIYPIELAIWITIVTARSASSFDLYLVIDLEDQLREKKLYHSGEDFDFPFLNPFYLHVV
jgi:hypothetical protein